MLTVLIVLGEFNQKQMKSRGVWEGFVILRRILGNPPPPSAERQRAGNVDPCRPREPIENRGETHFFGGVGALPFGAPQMGGGGLKGYDNVLAYECLAHGGGGLKGYDNVLGLRSAKGQGMWTPAARENL